MINKALNLHKEKRRETELIYSTGKCQSIEGESSCNYISANGSDKSSEYSNAQRAKSVPSEGESHARKC